MPKRNNQIESNYSAGSKKIHQPESINLANDMVDMVDMVDITNDSSNTFDKKNISSGHNNYNNYNNHNNYNNNGNYSNHSNHNNQNNYGYNKPKHHTYDSSNNFEHNCVNEYIKLISEKQNFILAKLSNLELMISQINNENKELKEDITNKMNQFCCDVFDMLDNPQSEHQYIVEYDDDSDEISECENPFCSNYKGSKSKKNNLNCDYSEKLSTDDFSKKKNKKQKSKSKSKNEKNYNNDGNENCGLSKYCVDEYCPDNMGILNIDDTGNIGNMDKTKKSGRKAEVSVRVNNSFPPNINPIQMILDQLSGKSSNKKNNEDENICSDDEYDQNAPIFESEDIQDQENQENNNGFTEITEKITNIKDLIDIGEKYKEIIVCSNKKKEKKTKQKNKKNEQNLTVETSDSINKIKNQACGYYELDGKKYSINLETIVKLNAPLKRLSKLIGMEKVKEDIFDMIIYYLQGFENNNNNMLHSVIEGPPGVGKTKLGKILSGIYCALGIIQSNKFKYVKATDLIGDHVGATKHMTQQVIEEADGGVLFIDEAYALSSNDNKDPYGKECIDTINFNLSENKKKLIVIIAGYPDHLDKCFFSFNPGLARRFPFKFRIDSYTPEELKDIFIDKLRKFGWKFSQSVSMDNLNSFFKTNAKEFPNFGGDIENFFKSCQFAHSKRMIGKNPNQRKKINIDDIKKGLEKFKKNKRTDETQKSSHLSMMWI